MDGFLGVREGQINIYIDVYLHLYIGTVDFSYVLGKEVDSFSLILKDVRD